MQKEMKIQFPKNGKIKIMQVSDPQDLHRVRSVMLKMLNKAYDMVQPDLVVFTGDNILGNHIDDAPVGSQKNTDKAVTGQRIDKALNYILNPLDERKIPYCMTYGNHDDKNCLTKQEQANYYLKHEYFVGLQSDDDTVECDTYNLPIYDSKGEKIAYNIWLLDSAGAAKEELGIEDFTGIKHETVEWYKKTSDKLKEQNDGKPVMSLMFQHVAVKETESLFVECDKKDKHAVKGPEGKYFKLDTSKADGVAYEYPSTCEIESGELEAIRNQGDVSALIFGHDHINCFEADLDGVHIIQSPGASLRCYGKKQLRGVRVFEIDENDTSKYETYLLNYNDIMGKTPWSEIQYVMSVDDKEYIRDTVWAGAGIAATALTVKGIKAIAKAMKK